MGGYECLLCKYISKRKFNYDLHLNSAKHKLQIALAKIKDKDQEIKDMLIYKKYYTETLKLETVIVELKAKISALEKQDEQSKELIKNIQDHNTTLKNSISILNSGRDLLLDDRDIFLEDKEIFRKQLDSKINLIKHIKNTGMLYILQKPKHIGGNIYKVGRTVGADRRFKGYDKDCDKNFVSMRVDDIVIREKFLHEYLRNLCGQNNNYRAMGTEGNEYYEMPYDILESMVTKYADGFKFQFPES